MIGEIYAVLFADKPPHEQNIKTLTTVNKDRNTRFLSFLETIYWNIALT